MDSLPTVLQRPRDIVRRAVGTPIESTGRMEGARRAGEAGPADSADRTDLTDRTGRADRIDRTDRPRAIAAMVGRLLRGRAPVLGFAASSAGCFVVDTGLFLAFLGLGLPTLLALALGRVLSSAMTFSVNRWVIFTGGRRTPLLRSLLQYVALATAVLVGGMLVIDALEAMDVPVLLAKIIADLVLFVLSYAVQRFVVFRGR